jgi:hypothetical protein
MLGAHPGDRGERFLAEIELTSRSAQRSPERSEIRRRRRRHRTPKASSRNAGISTLNRLQLHCHVGKSYILANQELVERDVLIFAAALIAACLAFMTTLCRHALRRGADVELGFKAPSIGLWVRLRPGPDAARAEPPRPAAADEHGR